MEQSTILKLLKKSSIFGSQNAASMPVIKNQSDALRDLLRAMSVVIIALSPMIGNAVAYPDGNRRLCQISSLLIGSIFYCCTLYKHHVINNWVNLLRRRVSLLGIALFQGLLFCSLFFKQRLSLEYIDLMEWRFLVAMAFWMAIFSLLMIVGFIRPSRNLDFGRDRTHGRKYHSLGGAVFFIGMALALSAWLHGPAAGQAMFTFGGSEIILASCTSMGLFLALLMLPAPWSILSSLPFAYLLFLSTARTGLLIFICMTFAFAAVEVVRAKPTWGCRLVKIFKTFGLTFGLMSVVILPVFIEDHRYPYYVKDGNQTLVTQRVDELLNRFSRVIRVFVALRLFDPETYMSKIASADRERSDGLKPIGEGEIEFLERQKRLLAYSMQAESRFDLISKSARAALENPGGIWPIPFENIVRIDCYPGVRCKYPHNFPVEVTLRFGWLVGLTTFCSLGFLGSSLMRMLVIGGSLTSRCLTVMLTCYLIVIQVTGNIEDHLLFGCLILLWLTEILVQKRALLPKFSFEFEVKDITPESVVQSSQHARG